MGINPKFSFWFGVWTAVLLWVASGSTALPSWVPHDWIPMIQSSAMWFGTLNSTLLAALHGFSSSAPGPLIKGGDK